MSEVNGWKFNLMYEADRREPLKKVEGLLDPTTMESLNNRLEYIESPQELIKIDYVEEVWVGGSIRYRYPQKTLLIPFYSIREIELKPETWTLM